MTRPEQLLSDFIDAWTAGRRPRVGDYLDRAAPEDRDELAVQLDTYLTVAPSPALDEATRAQIEALPAVARILAATSGAPELLPETVARLREAQGRSREELAALVARSAGVEDPDGRMPGLLGDLEAGRLDPGRISRRLLGALAEVLGAGRDALEAAADAQRGLLRPAAPAASMMFRADGDTDDVASGLAAIGRAAMTPAPQPMDEIDRLFTGGRDA